MKWMRSSWAGFLIAGAVVWAGAIAPSAKKDIFLDSHALLLVLGGTFAATLIAFPFKRIIDLFDFLFFGVLLKRGRDTSAIAQKIVQLSMAQQINKGWLVNYWPENDPEISHPFLREALYILKSGRLDTDEFSSVLESRSHYFLQKYTADAKMLNALAKFPPAFGLLGASTGMIAMMMNLGVGGAEKIGPAMAIALVATFWGIGLANLIILPLADHALRTAEEDNATRKMIAEGLTLIKEERSMDYLAEKISSFLPLGERNELLSYAQACRSQIQSKKAA